MNHWEKISFEPRGKLGGEQWLPCHIKSFSEGAVVLELGCGEGHDTEYLLGLGCKVFSTDLQEGQSSKG